MTDHDEIQATSELESELRHMISTWRDWDVHPGWLPGSITTKGPVRAVADYLAGPATAKRCEWIVDRFDPGATVEALVIKDRYRTLFRHRDILAAYERLTKALPT